MRCLIWAAAVGMTLCAAVSTAQADDLSVAREVAARLHGSGKLQGYSIGVKHRSGVVWLKGQVANDNQRRAAEHIASQSPNVAKVINRLTIGGNREGATEQVVARYEEEARRTRRSRAAAVQAAAIEEPTIIHEDYDEGEVIGESVEGPIEGSVSGNRPLPIHAGAGGGYVVGGGAPASAVYDEPNMPGYAWPSYAAYPNYAAVTYPKQYSPTAWPFIGPFYPYPQVPLGWRKVTLEWDDGWWMLDFKD